MEESTNDNKKNEALSEIYKIFKEIYLKAPPFLKYLCDMFKEEIGYEQYLNNNSLDFTKVNKKFLDEEYSSMTDAIKDIRLVFLNCYTFYGAKSDNTKKSLQLEELLEQKISCLDEDLKQLCDIKLTLNSLDIKENPSYTFKYPKNVYDSILLRSVAHCCPERQKEYHKLLSSMLTTDEQKVYTLEELSSWEKEIHFNDNYHCISSIWEVLEIGSFVSILFKEIGFDVVNQGEIEGMFLMPKESTTMSKIMTTLLMPIQKVKNIKQVMPYTIWCEKLSIKVSEWSKVYNMKNRNKISAMTSLGIIPHYWTVVGDKNPLLEHDYCELPYGIKVWLVKGLCDYNLNKYKIVNDIIRNYNKNQCTIWQNDMETEKYFYLSSMPDFRLYYSNITYDEPSLEFLKSEENNEEMNDENALSSISGSCVKPNDECFKLIADSVQGLRLFLDELDTDDTSVPESLINALEDLIVEIEPNERNLIILNNNSKIKLFEDWKSYPERSQKDKDAVLFWEGKEQKRSTFEDNSNEIIYEKRKSRAVVKPEVKVLFDSDEYITESENESLCDFSDSDDEWGALNQPKTKAKQPVQTHSKLDELEKRLKDELKLKNRNTPNTSNSRIIKKACNVLTKKLKEFNGNKQKENEIKEIDKVNSFNNNNNNNNNNNSEKLDFSTNIDKDVIKIVKVFNNEEVLSFDSEKEENKNQAFVIVNSDYTNNKPNDNKKRKSDSVKDYYKDIMIDDNNGDFTRKQQLNGKKRKNDYFKVDCQDIIIIDDESDDFTKKQQLNDKKRKIDSFKDNHLKVISINDDNVEDNLNAKISNNSAKQIGKTNKLNTNNKPPRFNSDEIDDVIVIEDDNIIISDDDDVQLVDETPKPSNMPIKISSCFSLNNSRMSTPRNRIARTTNSKQQVIKQRVAAPITIPKLSSNISIMPANVNVPKGIHVTMVKNTSSTIPHHFNATKRPGISNGHQTSAINPKVVNVKCKVISKPNSNGEAKFYIILPKGKLHPVSDALINQYLKENNNILPDYWLVPLPIEVAKEYGFN